MDLHPVTLRPRMVRRSALCANVLAWASDMSSIQRQQWDSLGASEAPAWEMYPPASHFSSSSGNTAAAAAAAAAATTSTISTIPNTVLPRNQQPPPALVSASSPPGQSHDRTAPPLAQHAGSASSSSTVPSTIPAAIASILSFEPRPRLHSPPLSYLRTTGRPSGSHSENWLDRSVVADSHQRGDAFFIPDVYFDPLTSEDEDGELSAPPAQTLPHDWRPPNPNDVTRLHLLPPPTWLAHTNDEGEEEMVDSGNNGHDGTDGEYEDAEPSPTPHMPPATPPSHNASREREGNQEVWAWPAPPPPPPSSHSRPQPSRRESVVDLTGSSPAAVVGGEASSATGPTVTQTSPRGLKRPAEAELTSISQCSGPDNNKRAKPSINATEKQQQQPPPNSPIPELDLASDHPLPLAPPPPAPSGGPLKIGQRTCIICMEPYTNASVTPCGHMYCHECLTRALKAGERNSERGVGTCPVCRKTVRRKRGGGGVLALAFMRRGMFRKR